MGKKGKDKKKGKGAEKTALKTEKKLLNKQKKKLDALGEDDIESIVAEIEKEEAKRSAVTEHSVSAPSRRVNFTFVAHPDKEELILYGGEFFNGQMTYVYGDLFFYNIKANSWTAIKAPAGPPPRCGHQMVVTSANKGQLWIFGGEYASPTQSQFYHYRDLWMYSLDMKKWEKIQVAGGPSARSGHRMVCTKKKLFIFGGFHDNLRDYKYFNDVHCFNLESYEWMKLEISGIPPIARSGCCMAALNDGRILIYGGYYKEKIKKDVDKGHVLNDSHLLVPDKTDATGLKYKWVHTKLGGIHPPPRCSMPMVVAPNNSAYCFGGVHDEEDDEENLAGTFFNDFYSLDLDKLAWRHITLNGKKKLKKKKSEEETEDEMAVEEVKEKIEMTTIADDGIFKVSVGPSISTQSHSSTASATSKEQIVQPSPRMNCGLAVKHSNLYLYGGMYEDSSKEITLADFYSLDLKKLDEWNTIIEDDAAKVAWLGSDDSGSDESGSEDESESDESMDTE